MYRDFFDYANEREHIRIAKETGAPQFMWTQDPVLQQFRFCNIFREDDRTTVAFRETVRKPLRDDPRVLLATIGWRWFNRIETCERVPLEAWAEGDTAAMRKAFEGVIPLVTNAYMIKSPTGKNKLDGLLQNIESAKEYISDITFTSLESAHAQLREVPMLGPFLAYEIITDLRHTHLLENAPDIMTWASAGPGCQRGIEWVLGRKIPSYASKAGQREALAVMRDLLDASRELWNYPHAPWEMREVEHTLCEFDKYRRGQEGARLKRRYQPS